MTIELCLAGASSPLDENWNAMRIAMAKNKSTCGVGFLGSGDYNATIHGKPTVAYRVWCAMLARCYNKKTQKASPSYIGCTVAEGWHNFQSFAKWVEENYIDGYSLDKDILKEGNKLYSPDLCAFVPHRINSLFLDRPASSGKYLLGVKKHYNKFYSRVNIDGTRVYTGFFNSEIEAHIAYLTTKANYALQVINEHQYLNDRVVSALKLKSINYLITAKNLANGCNSNDKK